MRIMWNEEKKKCRLHIWILKQEPLRKHDYSNIKTHINY